MTRRRNVAFLRQGWLSSRQKRRNRAIPVRRIPRARWRLLLLGAPLLASLSAAYAFGAPPHAAPKLKVLWTFRNIGGAHPFSAGLVADGAGNLYGATYAGGVNGDGAVYELSPPTEGKPGWTGMVLHSFKGSDGETPLGALIVDGEGNLYGTTAGGGATNDGVVFELSPPKDGQTLWTETVLHAFDGADGRSPAAGLIEDGAGNLYGTTMGGGTNNNGVVFELKPPAGGQTGWTETVLQSFNGTNGSEPKAVLIADGTGDLYGTAYSGGVDNKGAVFELSPPAGARRNGQRRCSILSMEPMVTSRWRV